MDWQYSLNDAVQLIIPWACLLLITGVFIAYGTLYIQFKESLYLSGVFISFAALGYVLFEALVVTAGWLDWSRSGPYFHRTGQLFSLWLPSALLYFAWSFFEDRPRLQKLLHAMVLFTLGLAFAGTLTAFISPHSFIAAQVSRNREILSPGDFYRGVIGPLYTFRDLFLGIFILFFTFLAILRLVKSENDRRNYLILAGLFFIFWGAVDDMIFYQTGHNFFLNDLRFSRVSLGITLMVFFFLSSLLLDFLRTQKQLQLSYGLLHKSEQKYRMLSEGADQAIFALDGEMHIHSFNDKAAQLFSLHRLKNKNLKEILLHQHHGGSHFAEELISNKLEELKTGKPACFRAVIKDPRTDEPEEYDFQFNALEGVKDEYIGRVTRLTQSRLSHYVEYEKLKLSIDNYIIVIDDVSSRLTHGLSKYMDAASVLQVKMGLQEMIINAIEHGNLGISFEEKSHLLEQGEYRDFLKMRQQQSPYKNRNVAIEYVLTEQRVKYLISDEGEGFDHKGVPARIRKKVDQELLAHGRGIQISRVIFDKVTYNKKGNQVLLEKRLAPHLGV